MHMHMQKNNIQIEYIINIKYIFNIINYYTVIIIYIIINIKIVPACPRESSRAARGRTVY